jgi:GR25 family glycosyltransferase involved in LPS biosynthesis
MKNIPFYYINLEDNLNRKNFAISQFNKYNIDLYTRVSAVDGRNNKLKYLIDEYDLGVKSADLAVTLSHLKAISLFANTDKDYCIICEDDVDLSIQEYWNFSLDNFIDMLPKDWEIVQLTTSSPKIIFNLHKRKLNDWGTVVYLIKQQYAKDLIRFLQYKDDTVLDFNNLKTWEKPSKNSQAIAEGTTYRSNKCYSLPLLSYVTDFESNVHQNHINTIHIPAANKIKKFWVNNQIPIDQLMELK